MDAMLQKKKPTWGIIRYQVHPLAKDEEKLKPRPPDSCSSALYPWVQTEQHFPVAASSIPISPYMPIPTFHQHPPAQGRTWLL